jgi:uncharacterized protein YjdB
LGLDATTSLPKLTRDDYEPSAAQATEAEAPDTIWPNPVEPDAAETETPAAEETVKTVPVARQRTQDEPEKKSGSNVVTGVICVVLGVAVLVGAFLLIRSLNIFGSSSDADAETPTLPVTSPAEQEDEDALDGLDAELPEATPEASEEPAASEEPEEPNDQDSEVITETNEPTTDTADVACDSITLNRTDITLSNIGETFTFTATVSPASSAEFVTWESSDIAVCAVDENGTVTAVNGGTAEIIARCGDQEASCIIRCPFAKVDAEELFSLNLTDITMRLPGETAQLSVTNLDDSSSDIRWESADPTIATVTDGLVTAVSNGTTTVTATLTSGSVEGQTMTCIVRCNLSDSTDSGASLTGDYYLSTTDATMTRDGEYFQLSVKSDTASTIPATTWKSENTDICYVDEFGVVYAVGNGTTTVSTTVDGQFLQCIVRVNIANSTSSTEVG